MHPDVWHVIVGYPLLLRLMGNGVRKPKRRIPGTDLSGIVESVGKNVTRFRSGDEVFGESASFGWLNGGAYAEFAAVPEPFLVRKPKNVTFEQAAAVPTAGMIALQNLGGVHRPVRKNVLINGAGGCMGPIAVQIAKADGAQVTAVDTGEKLQMLRSSGADHVIDYRTENYLENGQRYDFIMDVVSIRSPREYKHSLTPTGTYIPIGHAHYDNTRRRVLGDMPYFVSLLVRMLLDPKKRKDFKMLTKPEALAIFHDLLASGKLTPVVARTFSLGDVAAALQYMQASQTPGRAIITP
jgi:NADPH:quinone reductase-like Zn-dependent oxidoreductase